MSGIRWSEQELAAHYARTGQAASEPPKTPKTAVRVTQSDGTPVSRRGGNKFGAVKTTVDNITFDSKAEARRYQELKAREAAGEISDLRTKCAACVFDLVVNGVRVSRFTADFVYTEEGDRVVEDLKSGPTKTRAYVMRRKLMKACFGIEIRETK